MNNTIKVALLTLGIGSVFLPADAAVVTHRELSSAVNFCQAFTPGPSNTIRNRVIGSENIGPPIAVACNFSSYSNGAPGGTALTQIIVVLTNGAAADASVTCTMLSGQSPGISGGSIYTVAKSVVVPTGASEAIVWTTADNPTPGAVDLGNILVGVNCTLPTNMTLSAMGMDWQADNGI